MVVVVKLSVFFLTLKINARTRRWLLAKRSKPPVALTASPWVRYNKEFGVEKYTVFCSRHAPVIMPLCTPSFLSGVTAI